MSVQRPATTGATEVATGAAFHHLSMEWNIRVDSVSISYYIWVSNGDLAVDIVYCCDFQFVESGAWSSTFFGYCVAPLGPALNLL